MDILYILGTGSKWQNNELKFSLRSLEKFVKGYNRVFLTGDIKPDFLNDKIIYNKVCDFSHPAINSLTKVLWTVENTNISENFVLNYDDNFFIKNVDIINYPYYYKGDLKTINDNKMRYRQTEVETRFYLKNKGKTTFNYGVHCPIIFNKTEFLSLKDVWQDCLRSDFGLLYRSIYCNWFEKQKEMQEDCKIYHSKKEEDIIRQIKNKKVFSICDAVIFAGVETYLNNNFINKSQWEK